MFDHRYHRGAGLILVGLVLLAAPSTPAGEIFGFRADGQGRYPEAEPVTEWGPDKNVVWKTAMPGASNACPVLCGDRLFVCSEPTTVVCVNRADGKILWQKSANYADLLTDADGQARIKEDQEKAAALKAAMKAKDGELKAASGELKKAPADADLKAKVAELRKESDALRLQLKQVEFFVPGTNGSNGYSSATPVTDGRLVWAVFGTGVVVCYDLDGNRKWGRKLENPPHDWGSCISPELAGDVLLVQYDNLYGLDAATGQERWKTPTPWGWGTPVVAKVEDQFLAFTCKGSVIRASDGTEVNKNLATLQYNSPLLQDGVLYYIETKPKAFKLPVSAAAKPEKLWDGDPIANDRYYGTPLVYEGLLYAINQSRTLSVLDAATGKKIYDKKIDEMKKTVYPSPTLGGKYIFLSSEEGKTIVLEPGREYKEVARNELEPFRSCPVFSGKRMYIRASKTLYCIGS